MYQNSFEGPTMWSHVRKRLYHFGTSCHAGKSLREFSDLVAPSTCNTFNVRSFHVLNYALLHDNYGLLPLNCIRLAF